MKWQEIKKKNAILDEKQAEIMYRQRLEQRMKDLEQAERDKAMRDAELKKEYGRELIEQQKQKKIQARNVDYSVEMQRNPGTGHNSVLSAYQLSPQPTLPPSYLNSNRFVEDFMKIETQN